MTRVPQATERPASVGLGAYALSGSGGVATYQRELITGLARMDGLGIEIAGPRSSPTSIAPRARWLTRNADAGWRRTLLAHGPWPGTSELVHGLDVDVPLRHAGPVVATIHDLAAFDRPSTFSRAKATAERLALRHAFRRADVLVAVSSFTADRVREASGGRADVRCIGLAVPSDMRPPGDHEVERARRRYGLPDRFVLHVGAREPRKRIEELAAACARLSVPLATVGPTPEGARRSRAAGPPAGDRRHLGVVPRLDLRLLYAASSVTAYISDYEGFGLPPVEAAACGAAVICTDVGGVRGLLADAPVYVLPRRDSIEVGLETLLDDERLRAEVASRGQQLARRRTWRDVADETAAVYRELIGS